MPSATSDCAGQMENLRKDHKSQRQPVTPGGHERSAMSIIYRHATPDDIDTMVRLHTAAFPGFFLTSLGGGFLRLLYRGFLDVDGGICIVAQDGACVRGIAVGAADPSAFFTALRRKRGALFALAAVPGLFRNPWLVTRKCIWALSYRGERPGALPGAGLLSSVAVSPEASGKGIGQKLVETFCEELRRHRAECVYLVTDETDNERVNRFYRKCGFRLVDTFERFENRRMNRWAKDI